MSAAGNERMGVVIPFPYVPSPERMAELFALDDEVWPEYDAAVLREANAKHAGRLAPRLMVVRD